MTANPYEFWNASQIAAASGCALADVQAYWPKIHAQLVLCGIADQPVQVAAIGTARVESRMQPIHEYGTEADWAGYEGGAAYAGRGFGQTTHLSAYRALGPAIAKIWGADPADPSFDLVAHPDNLLDPDMAAAALAILLRNKATLQGYTLVQAARAGDWDWVRRLVYGGPDPAGTAVIANIATALGASMSDPVYDPSAPVDQQVSDWSCAVESTKWALTAFGRHPAEGWLESQMIADGVESTAQGLLDGSGAALARWITTQYGPGNNDPTLNYHATSQANVSFSDIVNVAGLSPVLIGGHGWNHWVGVRRYSQSNDWLELANSADGYKGVQQTLTRAQFEALGPFSMVAVNWGEPAPPPVPNDQSAQIAALTAQVQQLTAENAALISQLGYARGDVADALQAAVNTLRGIGV